ncbi:AraC family transcriptional regulator [Paenibacillus eucommiae]|uniref:AraC-like DNA-binding protein/mannose-6-phosphate isomerase-like protein (Cupin superfamily) n=1 Tax=Paenibacillus eucommiae TaxID=1355755 RepID=A0ABS4IT13_9BACL|nr:AraC family transcriptional regulator [Paenibacillus eucommiae]MBP1990711.1 AraC-like DNA-binding protein/mannose-6-phosphate isomerase-like protein (cupin superfamily) [Paenibacillus eucommiae]
MSVTKVVLEAKGETYFNSALPIHVNRAKETLQLAEHTHDFVEICYVCEGKGFHVVNDQIIPVTKGDLFVIPIGTSHVFRPDSAKKNQQLIVYNCLFQMEPILEFSQAIPIDDDPDYSITDLLQENSASYLHCREQGSELAELFNKLHQEFGQRTIGYPLMRFTLLIQLLVQISRYRNKGDPSIPLTSLSSSINQALDYMKLRFNQPLTLELIAQMTGLSSRQFYRLFKQQTGQTFVQYLQNIRITKSCELLRSTDNKINEIAYLVGYHDLKFFHAMFKQRLGLTPRQYRMKEREQGAVADGSQVIVE